LPGRYVDDGAYHGHKETLTMNHLPRTRPDRARSSAGLRRRLTLTGLAVAGLGATAAVTIPTIASTESTAGASTPCVLPEAKVSNDAGFVSPNVTCPPPPSSSIPPSTTTPPPVIWSASVNILDLTGDPTSWDHNLRGEFVADKAGRFVNRQGPTTWTNPSGPDANTEGHVDLTNPFVPPGTGAMGFALYEASNSTGTVCRSQTLPSAIPPTGRSINAIIDKPVTEGNDALAAAAAQVPKSIDPSPSLHVDISSFGLQGTQGGTLQVDVAGHADASLDVDVGTIHVDASFTYSVQLSLVPSISTDPTQIVVVEALTPGSLTIHPDTTFDSVVIDQVRDQIEPVFRSAVAGKIQDQINAQISHQSEALWFSTLGYTISLRNVTVDGNGLTISPTLCRFA
jgi:hypothetical protein